MSAKTFDQCLREVKSRSWRGPDSTNLADWSPEAIDMLLQLIEAGTPVIKARQAARELKSVNAYLDKLTTAEGLLKAAQMKDLRDPYLQWLEAARSGPLNWQ